MAGQYSTAQDVGDVSPSFQHFCIQTQIVLLITGITGSVLATYGRIVATKKIA